MRRVACPRPPLGLCTSAWASADSLSSSQSRNWLWNTIIAVITPYMVGEDEGNLRSSVFFVWGALCTAAFVYVSPRRTLAL